MKLKLKLKLKLEPVFTENRRLFNNIQGLFNFKQTLYTFKQTLYKTKRFPRFRVSKLILNRPPIIFKQTPIIFKQTYEDAAQEAESGDRCRRWRPPRPQATHWDPP